MKRILLGAVLATLVCGCGEKRPTLAGGKPVSYWVEAVKGSDAKLRKTAVFKLGNVGPADPAAFPTVAAALADRDPAVRCEAILAVLKFGDQARDAESRLAEMEKQDKDAKVRTSAAKALQKLQGNGRLGR